MSALAISAAEREPAREALAGADHVRHDAVVLARPHLPGASDAALDLVHHEQDPVPVAQLTQFGEPAPRRDDVATLALDRLDEDRRHVVGLGEPLEQHLFDVGGAVELGLAGVWSVEAAPHQGAEPAALARLRRGEREAAERATVEAAEERDHVRTPGRVASQLDRAFDGFGPRVGQEHPRRLHRRAGGESLADLGVGGQVEVARAVVQDVVDLSVDRGVDARMGVAGGRHRDAGVEVEEAVAVDVFDDAAGATPHDERVHPRQRRARHPLVAFDDRTGGGPGQLGEDPRLARGSRGRRW